MSARRLACVLAVFAALPAATRPPVPAATRPSGPAATRPSGPAATRPSGPAATRPSVPAATRPSALAATRPSGDDPVVAQRGADRITLSQARAIIASLDADTRAKLATKPALSGLLRNVLVQRAVLAQARVQKWDQRPEVAAAAQRARDLAVGESFLAAQAAIPPAYPAEADIQAAYAQNTARLMQPRSYHLAQIFVPAARADAKAARAALLAAARHLPQGGLAAVARQVPGGAYGDLGWLPETQVAPAVRAMVSGLQEGAVGDPLCTPDGCHLVQLVATRPAGPAPIEAVRAALAQALRQQKRAQAEQAYADTLLARQPVELNETALAQVAQ